MKKQFSDTSKKRLETMHEDLQMIFITALRRSMIDFGIAVGHRPVEIQQDLYASGRTKEGPILTYIDGINKKGKHNFTPSLAGDFYAWVNGKASWQEKHMIYLGGVITSVASELWECCQINHEIRWGGNFDQDDEILDHGSFIDLPHIELITD